MYVKKNINRSKNIFRNLESFLLDFFHIQYGRNIIFTGFIICIWFLMCCSLSLFCKTCTSYSNTSEFLNFIPINTDDNHYQFSFSRCEMPSFQVSLFSRPDLQYMFQRWHNNERLRAGVHIFCHGDAAITILARTCRSTYCVELRDHALISHAPVFSHMSTMANVVMCSSPKNIKCNMSITTRPHQVQW